MPLERQNYPTVIQSPLMLAHLQLNQLMDLQTNKNQFS